MKRSTQAKMHAKGLAEYHSKQKRLIDIDTAEEVKKLNARLEQCNKCDLCELKENKISSGECFGKLVLNNLHKTIFKPTILFVGQNPSYRRFDPELRAFYGVDNSATFEKFETSGDLFRLCLEKSDIRDYDIWVTNYVHCSTEKNQLPTTDQINSCFDWLLEEIDLISPRLIVAMGNESYNVLNEKLKGKKLVKIWHPSACMYKGRESIYQLIQQLNDLVKVC